MRRGSSLSLDVQCVETRRNDEDVFKKPRGGSFMRQVLGFKKTSSNTSVLSPPKKSIENTLQNKEN